MSLELLRHYNIISFEQIDSTSQEAKRLARAGASGNFLIISKTQTASVGRKMRKWDAPEGNLNLTIMLQTSLPLEKLYNFVFISGVALLDTIKQIYNESKPNDPGKNLLQLKWPNDLLINGKKTAGILIESLSVNDKCFKIIGVGVNILNHPNIEQKQICSLSSELGIDCTPEQLAVKFVERFDKYCMDWKKTDNFSKIKSYWLEHAYKLGEKIAIDLKAGSSGSSLKQVDNAVANANDSSPEQKILSNKPKKPSPTQPRPDHLITGIFIGIDDNGAILLEDDEGKILTLDYGEVV